MRRKLAEQIERETNEKQRANEAAAALAKRSKLKTQREIDEKLALYAAATKLAV